MYHLVGIKEILQNNGVFREDDSNMPIWILVEKCAIELTEKGLSPFTRSDIIQFVQRKNAKYGANSINPIIQGLTDNLQGGAPGAVGKNILHSVERGRFVLFKRDLEQSQQLTNNQPTQRSISKTSKNSESVISKKLIHQISENIIWQIGDYDFQFICDIELARDANGDILSFLPQAKYKNTNGLPLNKYGKGPFCRFRISQNFGYSGVYALVEETEIMYIGECLSLSSRYNLGYGNISPRNCFIGGQETNCRINNLILQQITKGSKISLWFHKSSNYKLIESMLRASLALRWNRV